MARRRTFAIVPAAGVSARMGAHKLLLPWGESTVIEQVLAAWGKSRVDRIIAVVRGDDKALLASCRAAGVEIVSTDVHTPDMKASVRLALAHISKRYAPTEQDGWLLAPADLPRLSSAAINAVITAFDSAPDRIVAPTYAGRGGHPTLFPWSFAQRIQELPPGEGINALLRTAPVHKIAWNDDSILRDLDTPRDYAAALACALEF